MPTSIALYEEIRTLSQRMVAAAQSNDWTELVELECRVAAIRDELIAGGETFPLSTPQLLHKHSLIQQVLKDDAEIRRHTEPWMDRICQYLGTQNQSQALPTSVMDSSEVAPSSISSKIALKID